MSEAATLAPGATRAPALPNELRAGEMLTEHIVEVISDSGEGAQRCGQSLGAIAAKMGNGIWTVEIIPAEIQPPARSVAGASGVRIRIGQQQVTNGGDETDLAVAFNEQVLLGRVRAGDESVAGAARHRCGLRRRGGARARAVRLRAGRTRLRAGARRMNGPHAHCVRCPPRGQSAPFGWPGGR